ncbi:uncharacterized protein LOC119687574 [Teleopsis dalmanni]|uniref:uncharacterized protein LOC119687574 n=1 Tax=Teleopsis dalmanni TaxID=139649 RepID=UPI000D329874|nr:uncharacterized protein LOC119687574 [Teleopsis dalmanni]
MEVSPLCDMFLRSSSESSGEDDDVPVKDCNDTNATPEVTKFQIVEALGVLCSKGDVTSRTSIIEHIMKKYPKIKNDSITRKIVKAHINELRDAGDIIFLCKHHFRYNGE